MIALVIYAVVSAVTVRNVGLVPDRSFRFRLRAVALVLTVGFTVAFLTSGGLRAFLRCLPVPDGMYEQHWILLRIYLVDATELALLMLTVVASFMVRRNLNRGRSDRTPRS